MYKILGAVVASVMKEAIRELITIYSKISILGSKRGQGYVLSGQSGA